ncbi:MAG TPA: guanylate kinase [Planctomycetota bacterium]|nr:guanylate kinase [Planctomycetota bacterium]
MAVTNLKRPGLIYLLIGPAGAGKNTLLDAWRAQTPKLGRILSATTRPPRGAERHGREYLFLSRAQFQAGVKKGQFAEWAEIHKGPDGRGDLYGKPRKTILTAIRRGQDLATDIDIQGARSLKKAFPHNVVTIFILPPSSAEIKKRLKARGTESAQCIRTRLNTAKAEIAALGEFDYLVINDAIAQAVADLTAIQRAEGTRLTRLPIGKIQQAFKL